MNLSSIEDWNFIKNQTPTFQLTPIEKPDLSPFLIHMTGKNSLISILKGESIPKNITLEAREGYLRATIPSYDNSAKFYNSEVVCFTESPIFALDFFRRRSFRRWMDNQCYGIGFSKSELVTNRGVRPVIYLDNSTNAKLLHFAKGIISQEYIVINSEGMEVDFSEMFEALLPLLFPLLEDNSFQGFMWEREWRCPDSKGMIFPHSAIKVICCPSDERPEIENILGDLTSRIEIVESWREYDEVTSYLKRRQREVNLNSLGSLNQVKDLVELESLRAKNEQTINTLKSYYDVFKDTVDGLEIRDINQIIESMRGKSKEISELIKSIKEENKLKEDQKPVDSNNA